MWHPLQHRGTLDHEDGPLKETIDTTIGTAAHIGEKAQEYGSVAADKTKEVLCHSFVFDLLFLLQTGTLQDLAVSPVCACAEICVLASPCSHTTMSIHACISLQWLAYALQAHLQLWRNISGSLLRYNKA